MCIINTDVDCQQFGSTAAYSCKLNQGLPTLFYTIDFEIKSNKIDIYIIYKFFYFHL